VVGRMISSGVVTNLQRSRRRKTRRRIKWSGGEEDDESVKEESVRRGKSKFSVTRKRTEMEYEHFLINIHCVQITFLLHIVFSHISNIFS